jgi:glycolate oxidase FAD binding subunit
VDLSAFVAEVGGDAAGPVTISGSAAHGGPVLGVRAVRAPAGIEWLQADEMTVSCGAATSVAELDAALAAVGQCVALPTEGTVGGVLATGRSGIRRLGDGPVRDVLLEAHYVSAATSRAVDVVRDHRRPVGHDGRALSSDLGPLGRPHDLGAARRTSARCRRAEQAGGT